MWLRSRASTSAAPAARPHVAEPTADGFAHDIANFVWWNELPVGSASQYAQWSVFKLAKENGVTVLLDGQGADELLGGYEQYFRRYLAAVRESRGAEAAAKEASAIQSRYPGALEAGGEWLKRLLPTSLGRTVSKVTRKGSDFRFGVKIPLHQVGTSAMSGNMDSLKLALFEDSFEAFLPTLLRYGDRNSMAHSREVRLPFLDHRLAEFVFSLPSDYLMGNSQTKRLLRGAMKGILPGTVRERWNKQGFLPPQQNWLAGALRQPLKDVLFGDAFRQRGWWDVEWWHSVWNRFDSGEEHLAWTLWKPFIAEAWISNFLSPVQLRSTYSMGGGT